MSGATGSAVPAVEVADLPADAALLDVRESDEWAAGHAPGARHLPMSELPRGWPRSPMTTRST